MVRSIIMPVAGPHDRSWEELREALRTVWMETTRCANWMMTQLYLRDAARATGPREVGRSARVYLYPEARVLFPDLPSQSISALEQRVQSLYRAHRHGVLWKGTRSLPVFRYPAPFATPAQAWKTYEKDGRWYLAIRICDRRWTLRLRGGAQMRHHIERLRQIESGTAEPGDATLYEIPAHAGDHRGRSGTRVMVKVYVWLPKPAPATGITLRLKTDRTALLFFEDTTWRIDAAEMRAVLAADARRRAELAAGATRARHTTGRHRAALRRLRTERQQRSHRRIADACRVYAAHAAAYATRLHAAIVEYSDADRSALPHFPWERLRHHIEAKLDERGIRFVHTSEGPTDEPARVADQDVSPSSLRLSGSDSSTSFATASSSVGDKWPSSPGAMGRASAGAPGSEAG